MSCTNYFPTIAVVIPNRDDSFYLPTCFASILYQEVRPDQIVFVDDQSTDESLRIAEKTLAGVKGVQIVANPKRRGTIGALNEGLKRVTSDYVLFLSSNDFLVGEIFARVKKSLATLGQPGVWSAMVWSTDKNGDRQYIYPSAVIRLKEAYLDPRECIRLAMKLGNWFTGTTLFFHSQTLQALGGLDEDCQGLADLLAALTMASLKGAVFLPEPIGVMRLHAGGYLSQTLSDLENLEKIIAKIEERGLKRSPRLFNPKFCRRLKHRFRFAALRSLSSSSQLNWPSTWNGPRYRLLKFAMPFLSKFRKPKVVCAFVLLRPFDIFAMFWYRMFKFFWVKNRQKGNVAVSKSVKEHGESAEYEIKRIEIPNSSCRQ